jgi:predicted HicB family RNase H-like nuclease
MNTMIYKGFVGKIEYDDEFKILSGSVINTRTVITFQGRSVDEITKEFHDSVDDYLDWCQEEGIEPEKPCSGRFNVRLDPSTHQRAVNKAKVIGISLNKFVEKSIEDELDLLEG